MKRAGQKKLGRLWIWTWIITKAQQRKRPGTIFTYINSLHLEESILIGWGFFRNPPRSDLGELKKKKINPRPIQTFTTVTHLSSKSADTNRFLQVLICILCWCWKDPIRSWWELWSHRKISSIRFVQYPIWAVVSSVYPHPFDPRIWGRQIVVNSLTYFQTGRTRAQNVRSRLLSASVTSMTVWKIIQASYERCVIER